MTAREWQRTGTGPSGTLLHGATSSHRGLLFVLTLALAPAACGGSDPDPSGRESGAPRVGGGGGSGAGSGEDAGAMGGPNFGNTDAGLPIFEVPDGGFPDAAAALSPGEDPDEMGCGSVVLEPMVNTQVEPGAVLVIFDNSGSMTSAWGDSPRWIMAGNAVRDAVVSLAEYLSVGAVMFPNPGGCEVSPLDGGQQIPFVPGRTFVAAWDNWMSSNAPTGSTPLAPALQVAQTALMNQAPPGRLSVVVLTDGAPNCGDASLLTSIPTAWQAQGILTHVVGLPGSESAVGVLDSLAMAGGTGQHLTPDDQRALRRQLANIVSRTVVSALPSCTIPLEAPPPNLDDVHLVVTQQGQRSDVDRDLGDSGGWHIESDGMSIVLTGALCDQGLAGAYERVSIEFGCVDLPPLPPPVVE